MNCIEKLQMYLEHDCQPCIVNGKIIEFEQLPDELRPKADYYSKVKDYIIYCEKCQFYGIIQGDKEV